MLTRSLLLGATASLALALSAHADNGNYQGWYAGLEGGAAWVQDADLVEHLTGGTRFHGTIDLDTGWAVLATVGLEYDRWRFEGELGYRRNDINSITFHTGFSSANINDFDQLTLMGNMLYDVPLGRDLSLSLGAGVGVDRLSFDWPGFGAHGIKDSDWQFAWQLIAGLSYAFDDTYEGFVNYRFLQTEGPSFEDHGVREDFDNVDTHTASIGLRYHFGS